MRTRRLWLTAVPVVLVMLGCASPDEWAAWKAHSTHFASRDHMTFSLATGEGPRARVARRDLALASEQGWWGKAIAVEPGQIVER